MSIAKKPWPSDAVETLAQLQARYSAALVTVFDQHAIEHDGATRPGQVPAQIFDFADGLRLLISRERQANGKIVLHVSASFPDKCQLADELSRKLAAAPSRRRALIAAWRATIPARFAELSGDKQPIRYIGTSARHVPHFIREET